ncbi:NAD-dependent succinate-semialdehyde dehydrogenase [Xanthobacter flavus]|uniref:NAD-dependent succinate-semialdehyde dehydrogenase n=1 Tax=Xanthobacter flavus TaxID=281 RepID=UPI0037296CFE
MIVSVNPYTAQEIARFEEHSDAQIEQALAEAVAAQRAWRKTSFAERSRLLVSMAKVLRANKSEYGKMISLEMGKPIAEAVAEVEKCALNCDFYAENAARFLEDEVIATNASDSRVVFDPLGVVLAIMPWNYPFWQYFRFAAPAFMAGNGAVLKHANNVPQCAKAIAEIVAEAGAPAGLHQTLLIPPSKVERLIADDRIAAVTLTGSTGVGAIVAAQAGKALKKQVLELGGSDPFIVLADADVSAAAEVAVKARFINVGQSCVNAKRFIVEESIADAFVEAFCAAVARLKIGDPMAADTNIGPMARADLRATLHDQVERSVAAGAVLRAGGKAVEGPGFTYEPTVLDHVTPGMPAFNEETFGPVAAIIRVASAEDAIAHANDTEFGLGAAIWTRDVAKAAIYARQLDAGAVFINGMVASDPRLPFGGIKRSGYGRELGSYGIREFTNTKTVWTGPAR